ncbi:hypothetical protein QE435_001273 [Rhizobium sp. SORGH_AS 787]|nr:hypothetical protein [Rhizobium sp. SORGH_AS_0787]
MSFRTLEVSETTHLPAIQPVTVSGLMFAEIKSLPGEWRSASPIYESPPILPPLKPDKKRLLLNIKQSLEIAALHIRRRIIAELLTDRFKNFTRTLHVYLIRHPNL